MLEKEYWYLENSFFSWTGFKLTGDTFDGISKIIFYTFTALIFLTMIFLWLFRDKIQNHYNRSNINSKRRVLLIRLAGLLTIIFMIFRTSILIIYHFPKSWEILPLHFCRLMCLFIGFILLFNKIEYFKYIAFFAIFGAILAMSLPDFANKYQADFDGVVFGKEYIKGETYSFALFIDNYHYWDYILIHSYLVIISSTLMILYPFKYKIKDFAKTIIFFGSLCTFFFIINALTGHFAPLKWKSNYFYTGIDQINSFSKLLQPITKWPFIFVAEFILGFVFITLATILHIVLANLKVSLNKGIKFLTIQKRFTFKEFFEWTKKNN